ncbi:Protein PAL1 [Lachnellula occidentalis]|uniref:Protein PAL1 n=1 Tax=Lachnellula occidentalis TaxID=215460 RepID=A0A8H8U420_9HELO|nr:Protein PAL1 [Lachnellula occidentalis]
MFGPIWVRASTLQGNDIPPPPTYRRVGAYQGGHRAVSDLPHTQPRLNPERSNPQTFAVIHTHYRPSPSPNLNLNLSSNNPFRNRAASPASAGQTSPFEAPPRPLSRNPFLDIAPNNDPRPFGGSPDKMAFSQETATRPGLTGNAADLFDNLTLNDRPARSNEMRAPVRSNTDRLPPPYTSVAGSGRSENVPPRHRPSRSQEEALRARKPAAKPRPAGELDIFADPTESSSSRRRVRRNSDSSVMSKASRKVLDPEEEKKRSERRRRERRHRERDAKDGKTKKPDRKLDIIDKLDVTSIYGTGLFHHDGPFDACNPHRNKQGSRRPAPMQAFPKDSLNNVLGGGGPLNKRPDHATFLGNNDGDAFKDYSSGVQKNGFEPYDKGAVRPDGRRQDSNIVNATSKVEPIHGEETMGLGTSTFLEGAPASRTAMQRRESENTSPTEGGGLGRKKSVAQRFKGITSSRRDYGPSGRITNPEGAYSHRSPEYTPEGTKIHESNPFFNEFGKGDDKPKESINAVEPERMGRARAPSSPRRGFVGIERRGTNDGNSGGEVPKAGGGFLSRVKSLKGGPRKTRVERMDS